MIRKYSIIYQGKYFVRVEASLCLIESILKYATEIDRHPQLDSLSCDEHCTQEALFQGESHRQVELFRKLAIAEERSTILMQNHQRFPWKFRHIYD